MVIEIVAGCWIDVFELSHFGGQHRRLFGPSDFRSLRLQDRGWGITVDSVIVGPNAYARLYIATAGEHTGLLLTPGQTAADLAAIGVDDSIDSLSISERPPDSIQALQKISSGSNFDAQSKTHG